jgi:hypothetical protein
MRNMAILTQKFYDCIKLRMNSYADAITLGYNNSVLYIFTIPSKLIQIEHDYNVRAFYFQRFLSDKLISRLRIVAQSSCRLDQSIN